MSREQQLIDLGFTKGKSDAKQFLDDNLELRGILYNKNTRNLPKWKIKQ